MANINKGILSLIGNTPLVEVVNIEKNHDLDATVLVKLEYLNPAGSVKDRIAKAMSKGHPEGRFCDNRADIGKYRYRSGCDRYSQGISCDTHDA